MTQTRSAALGGFARFALLVVAMSALLGVVGYFPTRSFSAEGAVPAMISALVVAALGSIIGAVPILLADWQGSARPQVVMVSMFVRLVAVVLLAAFVALTLGLEPAPFLIWLALAYLLLLVVDTRYAMKALEN